MSSPRFQQQLSHVAYSNNVYKCSKKQKAIEIKLIGVATVYLNFISLKYYCKRICN